MTIAQSPDKQAKRPRAPLDERVEKQLATYWRIRVTQTIDKFETEARRMLTLEAELAVFAADYYAVVGEAAGALAALEEEIMTYTPTPGSATSAELGEMLSYSGTAVARAQELKSRYRTIAKAIHPDRAGLIDGAGVGATQMHVLNSAYSQGDLAALLKLEAQLQLTALCDDVNATTALERALHDVGRAADTYAQGYRELLHSPLNQLMLRAIAAQIEGWDFMESVIRKIERAIEEREHELSLLKLSALENGWQPTVHAA